MLLKTKIANTFTPAVHTTVKQALICPNFNAAIDNNCNFCYQFKVYHP